MFATFATGSGGRPGGERQRGESKCCPRRNYYFLPRISSLLSFLLFWGSLCFPLTRQNIYIYIYIYLLGSYFQPSSQPRSLHDPLKDGKALPHFPRLVKQNVFVVCLPLKWPWAFQNPNRLSPSGYIRFKPTTKIDNTWVVNSPSPKWDPIGFDPQPCYPGEK